MFAYFLLFMKILSHGNILASRFYKKNIHFLVTNILAFSAIQGCHKQKMDRGSAFLAAKHCIVSAAVSAPDCKVVLFGSAALDLYIDPYMRFGETGSHQDMDFLLVPSRDGDDDDGIIRHLETFFANLHLIVEMAFPVMASSMSWTFNMTSNRRYCGHFFVGGRHFADVTVLPSAVDAVMEAAFPRQDTAVQLFKELQTVEDQRLCVASLPELLHRLASISESTPLVDGLAVLRQEHNKLVIQKSRLRLRRLRQLKQLGLLRNTPYAWGAEDPRALTEPPCSVVFAPAVMPDFAASCVSYKDTLTGLATCLDTLFTTFAQTVGDRVSTLHCKLNAANASGKRLAACLSQVSKGRRSAEAVKARMKSVRVDVLAAAHPARVLNRVHSGIKDIRAAMAVKAVGGGTKGDAVFTDYADLYNYMVQKMTLLHSYPYTLFPLTRTEDLLRSEPCVAKQHIMATFFVFLRIMHLSKGGMVDQDVRVYIPSKDRVEHSTMMDWFAAYAKGLKESDSSIEHCIPYVEDGGDGRIKVAVMHSRRDNLEYECTTSPENMAVMMRLLDNVVHSITYPILLHVKTLKSVLASVNQAVQGIEEAVTLHMSSVPHTPFAKEISGMQEIQRMCAKVMQDEQDDVYSWLEGFSGVKKRSKKKKLSKKK